MPEPAIPEFALGLLTLFLSLNNLQAWNDTHSLCYHFTITPKPRPGQLWCEVQGQLDENMFLKYHCESEKSAFHQGMKNEILKKILETQKATLKEVAEDIKKKLFEIMQDFPTASDPFSLQVKLKCEKEASGRTHGSWEFGFDRQTCLLFDTEKRVWKEFNSDGAVLNKTLGSDFDLTELFMKISNGDCRLWLEKVLMHSDELLETATPQTKVTSAVVSKSTAIIPVLWILTVLLTSIVMMTL